MSPLKAEFDTSEALAAGVARSIADTLTAAIAARGRAFVALSGGSTPIPAYRRLAKAPVDWSKVVITLGDDRWLAPDDPRSNHRLLRETLFDLGVTAEFVPLYIEGADPYEGAGVAEKALAALPWPMDLNFLGMGEDGHTASLIPGGDTLAAALDPRSGRRLMGLAADSVPEPRITMALPALLDARHILVMFEGEAKRDVYRRALRDGPVEEMPIRAILRQDEVPVDVFYA